MSMFKSVFCCAAFGAAVFTGSAFAEVRIDDAGLGFVGKGDVQAIYDWNNTDLQTNAGTLAFRYSSSASASWDCVGTNPQGKLVTQQYAVASVGVDSVVILDSRKNKQGQITGFMLGGFTEGSSTSVEAGGCPTLRNWQVQPVLTGEIRWDGSSEPTLQVSNGDDVWHLLIQSL